MRYKESTGKEINDDLLSCARELDRHYIPARYPNAHPSGTPHEAYDSEASQRALNCSKKILNFVEEILCEKQRKRVKTVVEKLKENLNLIAVILFGSRARGDYTKWSDYDILIITDFEERYPERINEVLKILQDIKIPIEPHPYTLEEGIEMLKKGNPTIYDALDEGKVLYKTNQFNKLLKLFKELKQKGMKRTRTSIIVPS